MKTIFRVLMLGIMLSAVTAVSVFAQDPCADVEAKQALYKQFTDNLPSKAAPKTLDEQRTAVQAGKQYVDKYGSCADDKQIIDYLKANVPAMEKYITEQQIIIDKNKLYTNFDTAIKASNTANIYATGKEILNQKPDFLDVIIALASAGFDQASATPPVDTYNNDVINYAKTAIQKIEAGTPSETGNYGVLQYSYKTDKYPGKDNALGLMNYDIAYIMYYRQGNKKDALPYFYKSTQYNAFSKNNPFVYQTIGAWYLDQAIKLDADRQAKVTAAGNKDTDETLALLGMQKGYAERSIDAYARAYTLAKADPKNKAYADALFSKLNELYKFRYNGNTSGVDAYVASVMSKPMPDPTTDVTPVKEEAAPADATASSSAKPSAMTSDNTSTSAGSANNMAKPTAKGSTTGTTTKTPANGTTTKSPSTGTTTKTPTTKKKGTR